MFTIRDGIWLVALAILCCGWYADHAVSNERLRSFDKALTMQKSTNEALLRSFKAAHENTVD